MFDFLKLAAQIVLKPFALNDKESVKKFLLDLIDGIKPLAAANKIKLDDAFLKHLQFVLNNDALFSDIFNLIRDQFSTNEIVFESAEEDTILKLCDSRAGGGGTLRDSVSNQDVHFEAINPIVIISFVSQIISIINAIKTNNK